MQPGDRTLAPKIEVKLEVRDENGNLRQRTRDAVNLATENWIALMEGLHTVVADANRKTVTLTDVNGSDDTYVTASTNAAEFYKTNNSVGPRLAIGDGGGSSVTPARGNHQLDSQLDSKPAGEPSSGSDSVTISSTFTNTTGSSFTVRETGMFLRMYNGSTTTAVLMYHDAVSATSVADGDSVTVTYTFTWP